MGTIRLTGEVNMWRGKLALAMVVVGMACSSWAISGAAEDPAQPAAETSEKISSKSTKNKDDTRQAKLEQEFEEQMSGCVMIGKFTVVGREDRPPAEEKYTISSVKKLRGNYWVFNCRIQYGKTDAAVPLTLRVEWADDTPVITLTDFSIPGMPGKFTSRVLIYRGWYAGTWQHDAVGGHLFGRIEKMPETESASEKPDEKKE